MDQEVNDIIKGIFKTDDFKSFYFFTKELMKELPLGLTREYIGLNFTDCGTKEIKFYVALFSNDISFERIIDFFDKSDSADLRAFYLPHQLNCNHKEGGTGITFTLKYSIKDGTFRKGLYFLSLEGLDNLFSKTQSKSEDEFSLYRYKTELSDKKLLYFEAMHDKAELKRLHYYTKSKDVMHRIEDAFNQNFAFYTHEMEIGHDLRNTGLYKFNMLMSQEAFKEYFTYSSLGLKLLRFEDSRFKTNKLNAICPGFYSKLDKQSVYYIASSKIAKLPVYTIQYLLDNLNCDF